MKRRGPLIFTSGMAPRADGVLIFRGMVLNDTLAVTYCDAFVLACRNAPYAAGATLEGGETIRAILSLTVHIAEEEGFTEN